MSLLINGDCLDEMKKLDMDWVDGSSNPIDLTGYSFKAQVRATETSTNVLERGRAQDHRSRHGQPALCPPRHGDRSH